jgi:hypothetical protein
MDYEDLVTGATFLQRRKQIEQQKEMIRQLEDINRSQRLKKYKHSKKYSDTISEKDLDYYQRVSAHQADRQASLDAEKASNMFIILLRALIFFGVALAMGWALFRDYL